MLLSLIKRAMIVAVVITAMSVNAVAAPSFEYFWPTIQRMLTSNSVSINSNSATLVAVTNWIATTGSQSAASSTFSTNWIATTGATLVANINPSVGFWGKGSDLHLRPITLPFQIKAGFWQLRSDGHTIVNTSLWTDVYWQTNSAGHIVARSVP